MSRQRQSSPGPGRLDTRGRHDGQTPQQHFLSGTAVSAALGGMAYNVNGRPLYPAHSGPAGIPYMPSLFNSPKAGANGRLNSDPPTPTVGGAAGSHGRPGAQTPTRGATMSPLASPKNPVGASPGYAHPTVTSGSYSSQMAAARRGAGPTNLSATAPPGSLAALATGIGSSSAGRNVMPSPTTATQMSASLPISRPSTSGASAVSTTTARPGTATTAPPMRSASGIPGLALSFGSNQSMGCRNYQEDFRQVIDPPSLPGLGGLPNIVLGAAVYDGHGGKHVSSWLASSYGLLQRCCEAVQNLVASGGSPNDLAGTLDEVFTTCGNAAHSARMTAGSCVAMALVCHAGNLPWVISANVGDSRSVLVSWEDDGSRLEALQLSVDHKLGPPKTSEETRRVQAAGGAVIQLFGTWRIDGSLAVARAIGDSDFSRYVSSHPSVSVRQLQRRDRWIIVASDGLFDVMTNEEVAAFCKTQNSLSATKLAEALVREAVRNRGSGDNTTVVAIRIQYSGGSGGQ